MKELFYLQDKRSIVGNSITWWAINGRGYTVDIRCAQVWTKAELEAEGYFTDHYKYKPWPKNEVDKIIQHHIDIQDLCAKGGIRNQPHTTATYLGARPT